MSSNALDAVLGLLRNPDRMVIELQKRRTANIPDDAILRHALGSRRTVISCPVSPAMSTPAMSPHPIKPVYFTNTTRITKTIAKTKTKPKRVAKPKTVAPPRRSARIRKPVK